MSMKFMAFMWTALISTQVFAISKTIQTSSCQLQDDEVITIGKQAIKKKAKTLWLQLDIISPESKLIVESEGINFVENKCTKIEHEKFLR